MGGSFIKIEGLDKALARFDVKKYEPQVQARFDKFGITVEAVAKDLVRINSDDEGHLLGSVFQHPSRLANTFGASMNYASFIEFGTRKYAAAYVSSLPAQWQELAASKRGGMSGTFEEFVLRLTAWVHRKGLGSGFAGKIGVTGTYSVKTRERTGNKDTQAKQDKQVAYLIARKILRDGLKARPFLYPAFNIAKDQLLKELNEIKL